MPPGAIRRMLPYLLSATVLMAAVAIWVLCPKNFHWPDRRPIGVLFLASDYHSSSVNPRGWFNDDTLDVTGAGGQERFQKALFDYADRSIAILKKTGAQGVV